jgi:hypothetical protein
MNKAVITILVLVLLFAATACSHENTNGTTINKKTTIADVEKFELLNKTVTVTGTVVNTVKIGRISGYKLSDETGTIDVSTPNLPQINSTITVTGTLMNSSYFGYYIQPKE